MIITLDLETPELNLPIRAEVEIDGFYDNSDCGGSSRDWDIAEIRYYYQNNRELLGKKTDYLDNRFYNFILEMVSNKMEG